LNLKGHARQFLRKLLTRYKSWLTSKIGSSEIVIFVPYLMAGLFSKNYLSFGIKGYRYFRKRKVVIDKSKVVPSHRRNQQILDKSQRKDFSGICILNLFPATFPRKAEYEGLPFAYFLRESATEIGLEYYDFPTEHISNFLSKDDFINLREEISKIQEFIRENKVSHILWYAHRRSATELNVQFLRNLREEYDVQVICWLTDNWNFEYVELANLYGDFADLILVNDFNDSFEHLVNQDIDYKVLWQPRPKPLSHLHSKSTSPEQNFIFQGTYYLNRIPWLILISKVLAKAGKKLRHHGNSNTQYTLSIKDYLSTYSNGQTISFHFLERTPGIYSLTASIWDAISQGSLVIVQTCIDQDPLESFFIPGEHYLRFESYADLKLLIARILSDSYFATSIAKNGFDYYHKNYNPKSYWQKILID